MVRVPRMGSPDTGPAPTRRTAYDRVEGLHLRQWVLRPVPFVAAFAALASSPDVSELRWRFAWIAFAGPILVGVASVLRVLAKGVLVRKTTVTTGGIYACCRHPFYLANLVGAVGTFLLAGPVGARLAVVWLVVAVPIYKITISGEETGLRRLYPGAWEEYAARVPPLLPLPGKRGGGGRTRVTWRNLVREREPPRLLRFLGGAALVAGLAEWEHRELRAALLAAAVLLYALSYVLPLLTGSGKENAE